MPRLKRTAKIPPETAGHLHYSVGVVRGVFLSELGREPVFTSFNDGTHMERSLHWQDRAFDVGFNLARVPNPPVRKRLVVEQLQAMLEPEGFDVVWEYQGTNREHVHFEYDPKPKEKLWRPVP